MPASSGLTIEIIVNKNIHAPSERHIANHDFCFPITLIIKNIDTKIETSNIFERIEQIKLKALKPTISKGKPANAPPTTEPNTKVIIILAPPIEQTSVLEIT